MPAPPTLLLRPRFWGGHLLMVLAVIAAVLLGMWQYGVWGSRRDTAELNIEKAAPAALATVLRPDAAMTNDDLGRPVRFSGRWLPSETLYVAGQTVHGRTGYWVMTPVQVGASAMPVVRGWTTRPDAPSVTGAVSVEGWLQPSDDSGPPDSNLHDDIIPTLQLAAVAQHVRSDLYGAFVISRTSLDPPLVAVPPIDNPSTSSTTALRNLLYAFQWWVFGGFAVFIWFKWCQDVLADTGEVASAQ